MLHEFLSANRDEIIARTRLKVAARPAPRATEAELKSGVPLFLSQLVEALRMEQGGSTEPSSPAISGSATQHGRALLEAGVTVAQVVHGYDDVCQAVTELAIERGGPITTEEFATLNRCLDEAVAAAVTEYARQRQRSTSEEETERLGFFAHELRNLLSNAMLAFECLKSGSVEIGGSTGALLGRNLMRLRDLIDRTLAGVRLEAGLRSRTRVLLAEFIEDVEVAAVVEAKARGLHLTVTAVEGGVSVDIDRQLLVSAVANLLQNAFKFTRPSGHVWLRTHRAGGHIVIEVEDECGGLPPGRADTLFRPFEQRGSDASGLGLGLAIAREAVKANGGDIRVQNLPGRGCIFTIALPHPAPESAAQATDAMPGELLEVVHR